MGRTTPWPKERLEKLVELWAQGLSASQCAKVLGEGLTRNSIIGVVHRHPELLARRGVPRLKFTSDGSPVIRFRPPDSPRRIRGERKKAIVSLAPRADTVTAAGSGPAVLPWPILRTEPGVGIIDLNDNVCRFPLWDGAVTQRYCGEKTGGTPPYCDEHRRRCFNPR